MKRYSRRSNVLYQAAQWCALGVIVTLATLMPWSPSLGHAVLAANHSVAQEFTLNHPSAVAVDRAGNLYIADTDHHRVLLRTPSGEPRVLSASLNRPSGLAVDVRGNLFIANTGGNRILLVTPSGEARTVLAFLNQPSGLAVDAPGNLYIADTGNNRILCRTPSSTTMTCVAGILRQPTGLAVDANGNLYIADTENNRILRRTLKGEFSIVRTGSFTLNCPMSVAVDALGNLYIADTGNNRVLQVTPSGGSRRFAGGGLLLCNESGKATDAFLNQPTGLAVDSVGNLYIADTDNNCIRQVDTDGMITTILP